MQVFIDCCDVTIPVSGLKCTAVRGFYFNRKWSFAYRAMWDILELHRTEGSDHSLSATAAALGHVRAMALVSSTNSPHIHACEHNCLIRTVDLCILC